MSAADPTPELEDQRERTLLAWRRTALSLAVAGILAGHFATDPAGPVLVVFALVRSPPRWPTPGWPRAPERPAPGRPWWSA